MLGTGCWVGLLLLLCCRNRLDLRRNFFVSAQGDETSLNNVVIETFHVVQSKLHALLSSFFKLKVLRETLASTRLASVSLF